MDLTLPLLRNILHIDNTFSCVAIVCLLLVAGFGIKAFWNDCQAADFKRTYLQIMALLAGLVAFYLGTTEAAQRSTTTMLRIGEHIPKSHFFWGYSLSLMLAVALLPWLGRFALLRKAARILPVLSLLLLFVLFHWRHGMHLATPFDAYVMNPQRRVNLVADSSPALRLVKTHAAEPSRSAGLDSAFFPGYGGAVGVEQIDGPDPLLNKHYRALMSASGIKLLFGSWRFGIDHESLSTNLPLFNMLNVRYFLGDAGMESEPVVSLSKIASLDLDVFESERVWPRAFFTDRLVAYEHEEEFIDLLKKSDGTPFAGIPKEELDNQTELAKLAGTATPSSNRKATPATDYVFTNNTTSFKINAAGPGVIVLTEAYVPEDFQVRVNGKPANYFRVNSAFKGLFVQDAGDYVVSFAYWPRYLTLSLWIAGAGLAMLLGWLLFLLKTDAFASPGHERVRHDLTSSLVPDEDDHFRDLNAKLDQLRASLIELRQLLSAHSAREPSLPAALESANKQLHSIKTLVRLLQTETATLQTRLERAVRETWELKAKRAETTARLKNRERLLEQIQRSAAWKAVKPLWKLFNRSRKSERQTADGDLTFALDLPAQWETSREILLIKGWCFSRSGRQIAGVRAKIGRKGAWRVTVWNGRTWPVRFAIFRSPATAVSRSKFAFLPAHPRFGSKRSNKGRTGSRFSNISWSEKKGQIPMRKRRPMASWRERTKQESKSRDWGLFLPTKLSSVSSPSSRGTPSRSRQQEKPLFSLITPTYDTKPEWLAEAALSLLNQSFADWEWCIVDDGSQNRQTKKMLEHLSRVSPRVRVEFATNAGISAATNRALDLAQGDYVGFLDHDDLLHWSALESVAEKLREDYDVVYSDEDKLDEETGELVEPFFKPAWSPEYFRGVMYVGHLLFVRRDLAQKTRFDSAFDGVQDFEFMLRVSETGARIGHIPRVLYHWRKTPGSIAEATDAKPQIGALQENAVNAHLGRLKLPARAEQSDLPHRLKILPAPRATFPSVSIIIPTKDAPEILGRCLKSVSEKTSYPEV